MITAGTYEAKILDYGLVEGKGNKEQVLVKFGFKNGPAFSWYGNLSSEIGKEITVKNLFTMGAIPSNIEKVAKGIAGGVLNIEKIYEVVVEDHSYNGKTSQRIKYINDPSKPRVAKQVFKTDSSALSSLGGLAASIAASEGIKFDSQKPVDDFNF